MCYEVVLWVETEAVIAEKTDVIYPVICIGGDCLTAHELSAGEGKISSETVFWLSGRPFLPKESVTDGSNSIVNFTLSNTVFCFNDDTECFVPVKRVASEEDAGDEISRHF